MSIFDRIGQKLGDLVDDLSIADEVAELYKRARTAYEAGDLSEAAMLAERVTRASDEHIRAWTLLGLSQLRREKLVDARSAFERALTLRPDDISTLALLARTQKKLGDHDAAMQSCKRALAGKVERELLDDFYGLMGELFLERGEAERAVRELRKAVAASGGADLSLVGLLGRALAADDKDALAGHHLAAAAAAPQPDLAVLEALVSVLLREGRPEDARLAALRLVEAEPRDAKGRCLLARAQLAGGDASGARETLLRALELDASLAEAHQLLARSHERVGDWSIAAEHLRVAASRAGDEAQREMIEAELLSLLFAQLPPPVSTTKDGFSSRPSEREAALEELGALATRLRATRPDDALVLAGCAVATRAEASEAMQLVARSLATEERFEGRMALALLYAEQAQSEDSPSSPPGQGTPLDAQIAALRSALRLRPTSEVARSWLREAFRCRLGLDARSAEAGLYPTFARVEELLARRTTTAELASAAARIQQDFDRPLLVAVMGEFNTGKSTFVNALIGEEIAPMGITPTTATINVLKFGQERSARVIWRDDREELLPWEQVGAFLRNLDHQRAREVRLVELLEPAEALLRVNVVDTPGLNSIVEEHEQTAREFLEQADAVIWLFAADQAGKETEELALELLQKQRKKTVGVLNKVDRLGDEELAQVVTHLEKSFSELCEAVVPVSARGALRAQLLDDQDALAESRFPTLRELLEQRIFSRSRRIKRGAARRKLRELCGRGRDAIVDELTAIETLRGRLGELRTQLLEKWDAAPRLDEERRLLHASFEEVFRRGADEVLDFVRPRRWRLGNHRAEQADRDFLLELLTDGFEALARTSRTRVLRALDDKGEMLVRGVAEGDRQGRRAAALERVLAEQRTLLGQQVYARFSAFARGFLSGGRIDEFFTRQLPNLDLEPDAIFRALAVDTPTFIAELADPLRQWDRACREAAERVIDSNVRELVLESLELEVTSRDPLTQLERELSVETGDPMG
ncbi:MAG: hypothetical protein CSB49_00870 [Proteobacteria bacterium]|nr:MAG: hypothetical protein CSB49_00870 [Pseudomonadota bacterium]